MNNNYIQYSTTGTGTTITSQDTGQNVQVIHETALVATLTWSLPATPIDGQIVRFTSVGGVTVLTMSGGTILNALTILAAGGTGEFTYSKQTSKWYKTI